jgi:hypothetical protein
LEDRVVDGRMGSEWILGRLAGVVQWIQLAQDRDRWRAVVSAVMNFRIPAPRSNSFTVCKRSYRIINSSCIMCVWNTFPLFRFYLEC